ncbi:MAG: PAS domain S-box protein [Deltaproteobacteria bacterium]|nr:PAS domain S-box protein [Deltaproteobacteria bacterium]
MNSTFVPESFGSQWQKIVDLLAELFNVPAALIMKCDENNVMVYFTSRSEGNPYKKGEVAPLDRGLYCESVMNENKALLVPDALHDETWKFNPDIKVGMISYLGFPLHYPDGSMFGTICVLDNKRNEYSDLYKKLLEEFRDVIEADLKYQADLEKSLERESALEKMQKTSKENEKLLHESDRSRRALLSMMEDMKITEVALKKSEEKFRRLVENLREEYFFYSHNVEGIFTYLSPSVKTVLGYSQEEFFTHYTEYYTDNPINDDAKRYTELCIKGEQQPPYELEIYHKNGTVHVLEVAEVPIFDEGGAVIAVEGIAHDITNRKKTENALSFVAQRGWRTNGENFFEALSRYLAHALGVDYAFIARLIDDEHAATVALFARGEIVENFEYALEGTPCKEVVGRKTCIYPENIQELFPEDEMLVTMGIESYVGVPLWGTKGQSIGHVAVMDGRPLHNIKSAETLLHVVAARASGELERKEAEDTLKESEKKLREAQHIAHIGHWVLNLLNNDLIWSDEVFRIFGIEKEAGALTYDEFLDFIYPEDRERVDKEYRASLENKSDYDIIHRILLKDGTVKYVREQCKTEYDKEGKGLRSLGTVQDITELKETEISLQKAKEEAEAASKAKSDFLSRMSHELRTPLNSILGFAQVMQGEKEGLEERHESCVDEIIYAGWHLTDLVNDVLDISKVESGQLTIYARPVNICPTLEECIALIGPLVHEKGVNLSFEISACFNEILYADQVRLKEIFLNLLSNAVKYNRASGSISVFCEKRDNGCLRISFSDTGIGLSEENQRLVFTPFAQLKGVDPAIQGAGIGVSIANHLVELMGGSMGVTSTLGKGSTFWVELKTLQDDSSRS